MYWLTSRHDTRRFYSMQALQIIGLAWSTASFFFTKSLLSYGFSITFSCFICNPCVLCDIAYQVQYKQAEFYNSKGDDPEIGTANVNRFRRYIASTVRRKGTGFLLYQDFLFLLYELLFDFHQIGTAVYNEIAGKQEDGKHEAQQPFSRYLLYFFHSILLITVCSKISIAHACESGK